MPKGKKTGAARATRAAVSENKAKMVQYLPPVEDVLHAVLSLYNDQLRPYSRILRKRLVECAKTRGLEGTDCDAAHLRVLCEACADLCVTPEEGGEWSALLVGHEENFIDIYSPVDQYAEVLWRLAAEYFKNLGTGDNASLPGGRYASALALAQRRLPFLNGYSLGQVCHITELAISQRKLLGYANGAIVAYEKSTSLIKKTCATEQRAIDAVDEQGVPYMVVDWDTARAKLREILLSAQERGSEFVPISNVKRLFRSLYHLELSETSLGYAKLTELLQDERFADICEVQLLDRGYVVAPAEAWLSVRDQTQFCANEPLSLDDVEQVSGCDDPATLAFQLPTPSPLPQHSHMKPHALRVPYIEAHNQTLSCLLGFEPSQRILLAEELAAELPNNRVCFCQDEPLEVENACLALADIAFPTPSPSPQYPMGHMNFEHSLQRGSKVSGVSFAPFPSTDTFVVDSFSAPTVEDEGRPARVIFCVDEPLCMQELGSCSSLAISPGFQIPTPSPYPQYSRMNLNHRVTACH